MCMFCEAAGAASTGDGAGAFRAEAWDDADAGPQFLAQGQVDALIANASFYRWNSAAPVGSAAFVTYSFMDAVPSYDTEGRPVFQTFSAAQRGAARLALNAWSAVSGVTFLEVPDVVGGQVRFGMHNFAAANINAAGYAYYPSSSGSSRDVGGDVWLASNLYGADAMMVGSYAYYVLLHEVGHAIGLKHPFDGAIKLPTAEDNRANTVMSYTGAGVASLGLYDLAAAQYLYGASAMPSFFDGPNLTLTLYGNDTAQTFVAPSLNSIVAAAGGDDVVIGGTGNDWLFGGDGADNVTGGTGNDVLYGDTYGFEFGNDVLDGGTGNDILIGGNGADSLTGGAGDDWLFGSDGADGATGGDGNDVFYGDLFAGEAGNDFGEGGRGNDVLIGGAGDDTLHGGFASGAAEPGADQLYGSGGNDVLHGGDGNDVLYGDLFTGEVGDDWLFGGNGNDFLWGGEGADVLNGGAGTDYLFGGAGVDTFRFAGAGDMSNDVINDFQVGAGGDVLDLRGVVTGGLSFSNFQSSYTRQSGIDTIIDFSRNGTIYQFTLVGVQRNALTASNMLG